MGLMPPIGLNHVAGVLSDCAGFGYGGGMDLLPDVVVGEVGLVIGLQAERDKMLALTAGLALAGPVRVLDGGNGFDAYRVARLIRRQTPQLAETLARIHVARAFTCYQVVALFEETAASDSPQLVFDLLATFYDESVSTAESFRLLRLVLSHIQRLRQRAPVIISVRPPLVPQSDRLGLISLLERMATHTFIRPVPVARKPWRLL